MKKLISLIGSLLVVSLSNGATMRSYSLIPDDVSAICLTNTVGITNLLQGNQIAGPGAWTNGVGQATANGLGLTNYMAGANATTMYTQMVRSATFAPGGLVISGTNLPGVLVVVVQSNLNTSLTGVMGIPPFSASNLTWAKTNDYYSLFKDAVWGSDWSPMFNTSPSMLIGGITNNVQSYSAALEIQLTGAQLNGSGNGSNYVTFVFSPLGSDTNAIINTSIPTFTTLGNYVSLQPFTLNVTNSANTTGVLNTIVPIPTSALYGSWGLRCVSATPGVAWSTGGSVWLTRLRLITITQ